MYRAEERARTAEKKKMSVPPLLLRIRDVILRLLFIILTLLSDLLLGWRYKKVRQPLPPISNPILLESAESLARKIRTGKLKSEEVVESYIVRIKETTPILNAVVENRFDTAIEEARAADRLVASGEKSEEQIAADTPLLGVPFTIKDSFAVKGMRHTSGSVVRKNIVAKEDAEAVRLMRRAGAIPIATTNVPELCMWWETFNNVYGRTNNPYNNARIAGGSSGGEGSNLSAAGSVIGIGSDIGGSIRMPAFMNGIFGHKPSAGIVSNAGQEPNFEGKVSEYNTTGPMCRYATDLLPMYKVLAASNVKKLSLDKQVIMRELNVFYMEDDGGSPLTTRVHPDIKAAMKKVIRHLDKAYGIKAQKLTLEKMKYSTYLFFTKFASGNKYPFTQELTLRKGQINPFVELVKWPFGLSKHTLMGIALCIASYVHPAKPGDAHDVIADEITLELWQKLKDALGTTGVFLYPTHPRPAPYHTQTYVLPFNLSYTSTFNILGLPVTHCPLGLGSQGLPVGISVVGALNQDHLTLAVARELEKAFGGWVSPSPIV